MDLAVTRMLNLGRKMIILSFWMIIVGILHMLFRQDGVSERVQNSSHMKAIDDAGFEHFVGITSNLNIWRVYIHYLSVIKR